MTTKQKRFIDEYILQGGNQSAAAIAAGYSENGAKVRGSILAARSDVRGAIDAKLDEISSAKTADAKELLEFLTAVMRGEIEEVLVVPSGKKVKVPCNCSARLRAAETLCRIYGLFKRDEAEPKNTGAELLINTLEKIWQKEQPAG